jgi:hypothetical protein
MGFSPGGMLSADFTRIQGFSAAFLGTAAVPIRAVPKMTCAAFIEESRMSLRNPSRSTRNPGEWRDLQFLNPHRMRTEATP